MKVLFFHVLSWRNKNEKGSKCTNCLFCSTTALKMYLFSTETYLSIISALQLYSTAADLIWRIIKHNLYWNQGNCPSKPSGILYWFFFFFGFYTSSVSELIYLKNSANENMRQNRTNYCWIHRGTFEETLYNLKCYYIANRSKINVGGSNDKN